MLKNISNLGKTLNKAEQSAISGGKEFCVTSADCRNGQSCIILPGCSVGFCGREILPSL